LNPAPHLDDELTEVKSENAVDRITSQANPRTLERVPAGARFRIRMVVDILSEADRELVPRIAEGLRLLEDDALGGGGSRGSAAVSSTPGAARSRNCWLAAT
jgi:CRISPR-associated protein Csm3